jgi:thiol-disulfide isomerase/thioredoxin
LTPGALARIFRRSVADPTQPQSSRPPPPQTSAIPSWALVASAAALVIGLAFAEQRKASGEPAPQVSLPLLDGKGTKSLQPGKVTLVDFWATWCGPCRKTMPKVQQIYTEYTPRGMDLFSVDTDDASPEREALVKEYLLSNRYSFPVVLDDRSAEAAFRITSYPTMLLLGKDGKVLWRHVGVLGSDDELGLRALLDRSLR